MSVKKRFVRSILEDEGKRLKQNQGIALQRKLRFHTHRLYNDRTMAIVGGDDLDGQLTFTHTAYQRFLDIKRLKGRKKSSNRNIHNRFVFGHYSSIASRLMNDLTDDVVTKLKELEN